MNLCHYGCGKEATHKLKNGKLCCSSSHNKCLQIKNKRPLNNSCAKKIDNHDNVLCNYGCGKTAEYKFKNNKFCCSELLCKCEGIRLKNSQKNTGRSLTYKSIEKIKTKAKLRHPIKQRREKPKECDYGCKQEPKYYFKSVDRWCCSDNCSKCEAVRKINTQKQIGHVPHNKKSPEEMNDWQLYKQLVNYYTTISIRNKFTKEELKQRGYKKGDKQLDHIFSISKGFRLGLLPQIIGSGVNLRLIDCTYNLSKNRKCDITIEELILEYEK